MADLVRKECPKNSEINGNEDNPGERVGKDYNQILG